MLILAVIARSPAKRITEAAQIAQKNPAGYWTLLVMQYLGASDLVLGLCSASIVASVACRDVDPCVVSGLFFRHNLEIS
jgi:hypothetical protein